MAASNCSDGQSAVFSARNGGGSTCSHAGTARLVPAGSTEQAEAEGAASHQV
jgi:hypothetical protein